MKKFLAILIPVMMLISCDKVKNPIEDPNAFLPPPAPNCVTPHIVKTNSLTMNFRKVLVEDYTGHTCGNCPRAAEDAEAIINKFQDSVVVIAVHAGTQFSPPVLPDYPDDYRTTAGTAWDQFFGMSAAGLPKGCVNRSQIPFPQPRSTWMSTTDALLNNPQEAKMLVTTTLDSAKMLLNVDVKTTFLTALSNSVSLCVVITEDSIVGAQKDYFPPVGATVVNGDERPDYEFEHMLRGAVNGSWGEVITGASVLANDTVSRSYNCFQLNPWPVIPAKPKYNLKHTTVVAFLYYTSTKVIIQVEKVKIM